MKVWPALLCACATSMVAPASAQACASPPAQREASAQQIGDFELQQASLPCTEHFTRAA